MARQFEKPETVHPAASGFCVQGRPARSIPDESTVATIATGIPSERQKKKIDPAQAVCLICNDFFPLFPGPDPLVQARVMGFTVGYKTIKATLAFEAAWSGLAAGSAALFLQPAPKIY